MNLAAERGHLPVVRFLQEHRREGNVEEALHCAQLETHFGRGALSYRRPCER